MYQNFYYLLKSHFFLWSFSYQATWNDGIIPFLQFRLGSNIGHGLIVWVEHPDIFCWVSFLNPTYLPAIFLLSAKPNKMAEDRTVPYNSERIELSSILMGHYRLI